MTDPGHVGDAADVENGERARQTMGECAMEDRDKRRPLATGSDVIAAKIGNDFDIAMFCKAFPIADLPGSALIGAMQDRMAVEADQVDLAALPILPKRRDGFSMEVSQFALNLGYEGRRTAAQDRSEPLPKFRTIGDCQRRSGGDVIETIGFEISGIDPVKGCAAHQSDRLQNHPATLRIWTQAMLNARRL